MTARSLSPSPFQQAFHRVVNSGRRRAGPVIIVAVLVVAVLAIRPRASAGVYGIGVVSGAALALQATGLVVVYRASRIINFAQIAMGSVAASMFVTLVRFRAGFHLIARACPPCAGHVSPVMMSVNFVSAVVLSLMLAIGLAAGMYLLVIRRFAAAPRLVLTVGTVFLGQLATFFAGILPLVLTTDRERRDLGALGRSTAPPFDFAFRLSGVRFHAADVFTVAVAVGAVAGLALYFRRTTMGVTVRAVADDPGRAETIGVDVDAVNLRVWLLAGALSGAASLLSSMGGLGVGASASSSQLVRLLAAAALALFTSLPVAAVASFALGVLDAAVFNAYRSLAVLDFVSVAVIAAFLFLQRRPATRAETEQAATWRAAREVRPTPRELRSLPTVRRWLRGAPLLAAGLALLYPWAMAPGQVNVAAVIMAYGVVTLSLLVLTGWAGQISLGQMGFGAIGAFVVAAWHLPFPIALVIAGLLGSVVAVAVGLPALKLEGLHLAVMTLAFALAAPQFLLKPAYLGRHLRPVISRPALLGINLEDQRAFYYFSLLVLLLAILVVAGLRRSRLARVLIAGRDNPHATSSFGVNLLRAQLTGFAVSGFLAALGGALLTYHAHRVIPQRFGADESVFVFTVAVIGGLGSIASPLMGAVYYGVLTTLSSSPLVALAGIGILGIILMIVMPGGIGLLLFDVRDALLRRIARRHNIVVPSLLADVRVDANERLVAPILPKTRPGGGEVFVPIRYTLDDQWAVGRSRGS